jgi:hypothetical protein
MTAGKAAAVALVMALGAGQVMADGNILLKRCHSAIKYSDSEGREGDSYSTGYCAGVVTAAISLTSVANDAYPQKTQICLPKAGTATLQIIRISVKYMEANPEQLHFDEGSLVLLALQKAFPCK